MPELNYNEVFAVPVYGAIRKDDKAGVRLYNKVLVALRSKSYVIEEIPSQVKDRFMPGSTKSRRYSVACPIGVKGKLVTCYTFQISEWTPIGRHEAYTVVDNIINCLHVDLNTISLKVDCALALYTVIRDQHLGADLIVPSYRARMAINSKTDYCIDKYALARVSSNAINVRYGKGFPAKTVSVHQLTK